MEKLAIVAAIGKAERQEEPDRRMGPGHANMLQNMPHANLLILLMLWHARHVYDVAKWFE